MEQERLRAIPAVESLAALAAGQEELQGCPRELLVAAAREETSQLRQRLLAGSQEEVSPPQLALRLLERLRRWRRPGLRRVVNATGIVLHTNLGRAPLGERAAAAVAAVARGYANLEYDLEEGRRGSRYSHVQQRLCRLLGAEDALVVNNNAAAVLLALTALAAGREVVVSRGELVEVGGSFRIPDVMAQSGAQLVEVGATNKTHLRDYTRAISPATALLFKAHTSNYRLVGFVSQPPVEELAVLAHERGLWLLEDLGSGTLLPLGGACHEPTVRQRLEAGVDLVCFSGDKLLGGGQAGILAGRKACLAPLKQHPLLRALRVDKFSLAALEGTLEAYEWGEADDEVPVRRMLLRPETQLGREARELAARLGFLQAAGWLVEAVPLAGQAGGGSLPGVDLPGWGVALTPRGLSCARLERLLRLREVPVLARIQEERLLLDVRCLLAGDAEEVVRALGAVGGEA